MKPCGPACVPGCTDCMLQISSRFAFLGENTSMEVVKEIVYPSSYLTVATLNPGISGVYLYDDFDCQSWFPMFAIVPKGNDVASGIAFKFVTSKST